MNDELDPAGVDPGPLHPSLQALVDLAEGHAAIAPLPADVDARIHARLGHSVAAAGVASKLTVALVIGAVAVGTAIIALVPRPEMNNAHADLSPPPIAHASSHELAEHDDNAGNAPAEVEDAPVPARVVLPSESKLVDQARAALRRGDLEVASQRIATLHRLYPHGAFAEERDALEALDDIKRHRDPAVAIDKFVQRHPNSVHKVMLDEAVKNLR
ncbi:MAG TPA: hypothetical protein VGO62_07410 [Myxococcota bacterium]|jgi:hypothetical protein